MWATTERRWDFSPRGMQYNVCDFGGHPILSAQTHMLVARQLSAHLHDVHSSLLTAESSGFNNAEPSITNCWQAFSYQPAKIQGFMFATLLPSLEDVISARRNGSGQAHSIVKIPVRNEGGRSARLLIYTDTPIQINN